MKIMLSVLVLCCVLTGGSALAQMPDKLAEGRILTGWRDAGGTHYAALEILLAPGWKTYWRTPGDAGIPPQFNWSGSMNLGAVGVAFPVPKVMDQNGLRSIGYEGSVTLPLALTPTDASEDIRISGEVSIGICEDICVPYTLSINALLPAAATTPDATIKAALADRPMTASQAGVGSVTCDIRPTDDGMALSAEIEVRQFGGDEVVVVELEDQSIWVAQAEVSRSGGRLTAETEMVPLDAQPFALARSDVRFTVLSGGQAVDIRGCN